MEKIICNKKCTGCTACMNICPKKAIYMKKNEEGFLYPVIKKEKCIDCGLCKKKCPVLNTNKNDSLNLCYVGYNIDVNERLESSSGGIFSLIANYILDKNGIVIGSSFDNNNLKHICIREKKELNQLKGSKYLQSELDEIFSFIKNNIDITPILFVGTPCQVAGLKMFLRRDYDNLICIDLICHGVPSPKLFDKYIKELENKYEDKIINYNFRDKTTGWTSYSNTIIFNKRTISELRNENNYMKLFLSDIALRESCYNCNFKLGNKYSDITLGDFWGVKNYYPEMYNNQGVSAIIINTLKGQKIFEKLKKQMVYKKCNLNEIISGNISLRDSCKYNKKRKKFFININKLTVEELATKYSQRPFVFNKLKYILNKIINKF